MPRDGFMPVRGHRALDLVTFLIADVQTGFGPFVAVYLTTHKWTQVEIGFALTLGTVTALFSQLPAGALVDAVRNKRAAASSALIGIIVRRCCWRYSRPNCRCSWRRCCTPCRAASSPQRSPRSV